MSLKRNAAWTALDTFASAGLSFAFRLVVAKILSPEEFGLAALALTIVAVLQVVNDFGLTAALIQKDEAQVTPELVNTTFTASAIVSLVLAVVTAIVVAPLAAIFYHKPLVGPLVAVLAISLLPSPFTTVASALLYRRGQFRAVAVNRVASTCLSLVVAGLVLWLRPSPWVIVVQAVASSVILMLGLNFAARWPFRVALRTSHIRDVFGFSSFILFNDLAVSFSANAGVFILGRVVSMSDAGLFSLATYMTDTVRRSLMSILNRVTFVHYSKIKNDKAQTARAYISTLTWNCRVLFPVMTVFMLFGPNLMIHFLGHRWDGLGPVIRWLSLSVIIHAAGGTTSTLYKANGKPGLDMALFLATTFLLLIPGMVIGALTYGLIGVAIATAAAKLVSNIIRQVLLDRLIGRTAMRVLSTLCVLGALQLPIVLAWALGQLAWPSHGVIIDIALLSAGLAIYGALELPRAFPALAARVGLKSFLFRSDAAR
jgi:teichuronic acid exporter